jgi:15-cis-phytoene synthase
MTSSPAQLEASYAACRRVGRRARSNFPLCFRLLPRDRRRGMDALYAFMRYSDDLVDDAEGDATRRTAVLARWRQAVEGVLDGNADDKSGDPLGLLPALADTVRRFEVPPEHLRAVLDGVARDLVPERYETFAQLQEYCELVASAVGLACIHVWGFRGPEAFAPARAAGVALQLTNILRDLGEDARAGRVYLPLEDTRQCDYSVEDLRRGTVNRQFHRLMEMEIARAKQFYREAAGLPPLLTPVGRRVFGMMTGIYRELLAQIERRPAEVLRCRMRVGGWRKLWIATCHTIAGG